MDMALTQHFLRAKRPCASGFRWFVRNQHCGNDYQRVLDALVHDGRIEDARWLMGQFGTTDQVLEVEHLEASALVYAGSITVHGEVRVPGMLCIGGALKAGAGIHTGLLEVGEDLRCEGAVFSSGDVRINGQLRTAWSLQVQGKLHAQELRVGWELECHGPVQLRGGANIGHGVIAHDTWHSDKGLRAGQDIAVTGSLTTGHGIAAGGDVIGGHGLEAGWGIRALGDIRATGSIRVGETLEATGDISAGAGYGIYAGLNVQMDAWEQSAWVRAVRKPEALLSGYWDGV